MKKLFKSLLIVLLIVALFRTGMGLNGEVHVMEVVDYLRAEGEVVDTTELIWDFNLFSYQFQNIKNYIQADFGADYTHYYTYRSSSGAGPGGSDRITAPVYDSSRGEYTTDVIGYVTSGTLTKFDLGSGFDVLLNLGNMIQDFFKSVWEVLKLAFAFVIDTLSVVAQAVAWASKFLYRFLFV